MKDLDWNNLGFSYIKTDYRFIAHWKDGKWDEGGLITDSNVVLNEWLRQFFSHRSNSAAIAIFRLASIFLSAVKYF